MAKSLTLLFLLLTLSAFARETIIISDLDDTIKITYSHRYGDALKDGVWSKKVFSGNTTLYNAFTKYTSDTVILSASYFILESTIKDALRYNKIPYGQLILRNLFSSTDKFAYKFDVISYILKKNDVDVIFIGDDIGADPQVYTEIAKKFPGRVLGIYIRPVVGAKLPRGVIPFFTAWDIAVWEFAKYRMRGIDLNRVAKDILSERNHKKIIPKTFLCPANYSAPRTNDPLILSYSKKITAKIRTICKNQTNLHKPYGPVIWDESDF